MPDLLASAGYQARRYMLMQAIRRMFLEISMNDANHSMAPLFLLRDAMRLRTNEQFEQALPLLEQALARAAGRLGLEAMYLTVMADCLIALGRAELAEPRLRRAIFVTFADWSEDFHCLSARHTLDRALRAQRRTSEAAVVFSPEHRRQLARLAFEMAATADFERPLHSDDDLEDRQIN